MSRAIFFFVVNILMAVIGSAILDRIEIEPAIGHFSHIFARGFGLSFIMAFALGFWISKWLNVTSGKWVWIVTTLIFIVGIFRYLAIDETNVSGHILSRLWWRFSFGECFATLNAPSCEDAAIFTTTLVRGAGYSFGALMAARFRAKSCHEANPSHH